jgi:cytochrome c oxidase subunit 2
MVVLMKRLLLGFVLIGAALSQQPDPATQTPDRIVTVTAERFSFTPSRIVVKQGQLVELVIASDDTDHGFRLPAAGVDAAIPQQGKGEVRVRFIAGVKGEFVFECSRPCGAGHNLMRGAIIVE